MDVEGQYFKPHDKIPNGVILKYNKCHVTLEEIVLVFFALIYREQSCGSSWSI